MEPKILEQRLKIYDRMLGSISAAAIIIGGLFSAYTYLENQRLRDMEAARQAKLELFQKQKEHALAIFRDKREAYMALTDTACLIAACRTYHEVETASKEFLRIYYGRAHLIADADTNVADAKIAFREALRKYLKEKPEKEPCDYFGLLALSVTTACKPHMDVRAIEPNNDLAKNPIVTAAAVPTVKNTRLP